MDASAEWRSSGVSCRAAGSPSLVSHLGAHCDGDALHGSQQVDALDGVPEGSASKCTFTGPGGSTSSAYERTSWVSSDAGTTQQLHVEASHRGVVAVGAPPVELIRIRPLSGSARKMSFASAWIDLDQPLLKRVEVLVEADLVDCRMSIAARSRSSNVITRCGPMRCGGGVSSVAFAKCRNRARTAEAHGAREVGVEEQLAATRVPLISARSPLRNASHALAERRIAIHW